MYVYVNIEIGSRSGKVSYVYEGVGEYYISIKLNVFDVPVG
jgi:hypothetical protein